MKRKRWFIGGLLLVFVTIVVLTCSILLRNKHLPEEAKIDENLYYQKLDTEKVIYDKDIGRIVSNELIVQTDDTEKEIIEEIVEEENGKIVGYIDLTNTYQVEFDDNIKPSDLMTKKQDFEQNEHVKHTAYNYVFSVGNQTSLPSLTYPNDREWKNKWDNNDMTGGNWGLKAIRVPEAWTFLNNTYKELEEIQMGVLESGPLDTEHEDLKENLGYVIGKAKDDTRNSSAHGTEVTGIIGAEYNNKRGISGVMLNNEKINYFSYAWAKDKGEDSTISYLVGLAYLATYAGKDQTTVINVSLGTDEYQVAATNNVQAAVDEATEINDEITIQLKSLLSEGYDFLIVKAAGNATTKDFLRVDVDNNDDRTILQYVPYLSNTDPNYNKYSSYYAKYKDELNERLFSGEVDANNDTFSGITDEEIRARIIVVGGIANPKEGNYPLYSYSSKGERIDIAAPATRIQSTTSGNAYADELYGTSLAAPYVSGVAGLMLSANPDLSGKELKTMLIKTGNGEYNFGMGEKTHNVPLVNAEQAVEKAASYDRTKITVTFDRKVENGEEYATISGINQLDEKVWEYKTQKYECTELARISEIGTVSNLYYFAEDGRIVALNILNGTVVWENKDFGGAVSAFTFDDDNILYICGYYGPDFIAIDQDGNTLYKIDQFSDGGIFWPTEIEYSNNTIIIKFAGSLYQVTGEIKAIISLPDYSYVIEGIKKEGNTSNNQDSLYGSWLQMNSNDPILLTINSDGTLQYFNSIAKDNTYTSTYKMEDDIWLDLLAIDDNRTVSVPYQIDMFEDQNSLQMSLTLDKTEKAEDTAALYGMETILEGTYKKMSFTQSQLDSIKINLGVPGDIDITITQEPPYYWEAGGRWLIQVNIYRNSQYIAGAACDFETLEMCNNIYMYSGS